MSYTLATYKQETISLARSLVIKYSVQNTLINTRLEALGYSISEIDETSWKYNLHVNGEYHLTDERMTVISSDTREVISFDKTTLIDHPRTQVEFSREGVYYSELVRTYPSQEILIHGIVNAVNIDTFIEADDFTIVGFNSDLVESNETQLISELNGWIKRFSARWFNRDFAITDPYYPAAFFAILSMHIPSVIMNIRLEYAKTRHAYKFFIWSHLSKIYNLDEYRNVLNKEQALWLHRNIDRLNLTAGRSSNLDELIDNLCTPSGVSLFRLDFVQTSSTLLETGTRKGKFSYIDYSSANAPALTSTNLTIEEVYKTTEDLALDNGSDYTQDVSEAVFAGDTSPFNRLPTGVIRSTEEDSIYSLTAEKNQLLLSYWAYLSAYNIWDPTLTIELPNEDIVSLSSREALILFMHALNAGHGRTVVYIPVLESKWVTPLVMPTFADLRSLVTDDVSDDDIDYLLSDPVNLYTVNSSETMFAFVESVVNKRIKNELYWESVSDPFVGSQLQAVDNALWTNLSCVLASTATTFTSWLDALSFDTSEFTEIEWLELSSTLLYAATGVNTNSGDIGTSQQAVVEIVNKLTSYSLIILPLEDGTKSSKVEIPNIRLISIEGTRTDTIDIENGTYLLDRAWGKEDIVSSASDAEYTVLSPINVIVDTDNLPTGLTVSVNGTTSTYTNAFLSITFTVEGEEQTDLIDMTITPSTSTFIY